MSSLSKESFNIRDYDINIDRFVIALCFSNVQVVTNMSSGVTSNSKYTTYGSLIGLTLVTCTGVEREISFNLKGINMGNPRNAILYTP